MVHEYEVIFGHQDELQIVNEEHNDINAQKATHKDLKKKGAQSTILDQSMCQFC